MQGLVTGFMMSAIHSIENNQKFYDLSPNETKEFLKLFYRWVLKIPFLYFNQRKLQNPFINFLQPL